MLSKTLIIAALAALAVAAPTPEYGRHRQGGHHNHDNSASNNSGSGRGNHSGSSQGSWNNWGNSDNSSSDNSSSDNSSSDNSSSDSSSSDNQSQDSGSNKPQVDSGSSSSGPSVSGGFSSIASYYDITNPSENEGESAGSVACSGTKYSNSDAIVAIASQQYNGGSVCGKRVRITDQKTGNTAEATIVDECMSCQDNQLDLTPSLWSQLHGQSTANNNNDGVFDIKWDFI